MHIKLRTCSPTYETMRHIMRKGQGIVKSIHDGYCTGRDCPECAFDIYDEGSDRGKLYLKRVLEIPL